MRLGITVPITGVPLSRQAEALRHAEELGFTDAWSHEVNEVDAFTPLAVALSATKQMRAGTAIAPVFTRPAPLLAMHAAALAELAPGRFVLGLGSSTPIVVQQWMGVPFGKPLSAVKDVAGQVRQLLAGERVGSFKLARKPEQPPPIHIAALGPKMLAAAGEVGDGVLFFLAGARIVPELIAATGKPGIEAGARILVLPGPDPDSLNMARRFLTGYAIVPFYARFLASQGFEEEIAAIAAKWGEGDRAGAAGQVSDRMLNDLVLRGPAERIAEGIRAYWDAGLTTPILAPLGAAEAVIEGVGAALGKSAII